MKSENTPPLLSFLPTAGIYAIVGWTGLVWVFQNTLPKVGPRWLFYFFWFLALTGTSLPFAAFLNRRFPGKSPATETVIVRQSIMVGLYGCILAWLQIGRVLTPTLGLMIAVGFILIEFFLRLRERSLWQGNPNP